MAEARKSRNKSMRAHKEERTPATYELMQKAVTTFLDQSKRAAEKRDKMLQEMIDDIALKRNCKESSAVKQIYNAKIANGFHRANRYVIKGPRAPGMQRVLAQEPMDDENIVDIQWKKRPMTKDELKAATWRSVQDPALMEEIILRYNEQHLTQSTISPFAYGPLRDLLKEDGSGSHLFTEGLVPPEIAQHYGHLEEAVTLVLDKMKHKTNEEGRHKFEWTFTGEDFTAAFGKARLNTAPGFSGLSMNKLQAISTDKVLAELYAQIISLPFKYGFTYPAWLISIQAMLQKEDLPYIHRLRIIELFELDLNGFLKYVVGRQFAHHDQSNGLQNRESYGAVKGKSAHDALNSIQNVLEYSRLTNTPIAIAPKDATGCFDLLRREEDYPGVKGNAA